MNSPFYLRGVEVKYWDNSIVIGEMEMYWGTAGARPSLIVEVYWRMGDCWRCSDCLYS